MAPSIQELCGHVVHGRVVQFSSTPRAMGKTWPEFTEDSLRRHTALMISVGADGDARSYAELQTVRGGTVDLVDRAAPFQCGTNVTCGVATLTDAGVVFATGGGGGGLAR